MDNRQLKSFKDLHVWQKAADLAVLVYKITENFPQSELYGLTNQMRRAVISISSNIAEGFKRNHKKEKIQFYNISYGSAAELESQIEISRKLNFFNNQDYENLIAVVTEIGKMLDGLIKSQNRKFPKSYILNPIFFIVFLYSIFYILFPQYTKAAMLYLEPEAGQYYLEDIFSVEIKLNTEGENINTVKFDLTFPNDALEVKDFSKGNSILIFWPEGPSISNQTGKIQFVGGTPEGYSGRDGLLGKLVFGAKREGTAALQIEDTSQILLNDGLGTKAKLTAQSSLFTILPEKLEIPKDEWIKELEKDTVSPEPFDVIIASDTSMFEGKYFVVFSTIDKGTGIDYYKIKEGERNWKKGDSPYILEEQDLKETIYVKAVDKAGNERIAVLFPPGRISSAKIVTGFAALIAAAIIVYFLRKKRKERAEQ